MSETPPRGDPPPLHGAAAAHAGAAGPRQLLRQIRGVMAERRSDQERLGRIVALIAANMVAEVCSIYVLRQGALELFATQGLNPNAVHRTRLAVGEGLVGEIARTAEPLNLADAQHHPKFAYKPETGEDPFQSFLGVPILRSGEVIGVLTVQNVTQRHYGEEEIDALFTIAMVLAEVASSVTLQDGAEAAARAAQRSQPFSAKAQVLAEGIAIGHAVMHEPRVRVTKLISEDTDAEMARLDAALAALRLSVEDMLSRTDGHLSGESRDVLETYRMFAHDRTWSQRLRETLLTGLTAEAAVERVQNDTRARMLRIRDPYQRERLHDLEDLANRLLRLLAGKRPTLQADEMPADAIILARNMGPAELLDYDSKSLRGVILEEGTASSHVAIVARALGLPMLGRIGEFIERVEPGDLIVIDGEAGELRVRPTHEVVVAFQHKAALADQRRAEFEAIRAEPALTRDGALIKLNMNAGLLVDLPNLQMSGADGIGLFRTELQFMVSSAMPRLEAQRKLYSAVMEAAGDKPVIFRTVDLGGDKVVSYMQPEREENPALGWRAIRIALDRPGLLRYQTRALIDAAAGRELSLMFPMVSSIGEFLHARGFVMGEIEHARARGHALPSKLRIGTMLEVPALVYQLTELLPLVDFVSIGSNDLLQFFYAADRQHPRLADRYDMLSAPFLRLVRQIVRECDAKKVPVSLCGEMAGRPLEAMALLGVGLRTISMPAPAIGPVKLMVRKLNLARITGLLDGMLDGPAGEIRERLKGFAAAERLPI